MIARLVAVLAAGILLAGCATTPTAPLLDREQVSNFTLEGRFALRVTLPGQAAQSSGGRLTWEHRQDGERILIANPIGVGIAEISSTPGRARLQTGDGRIRESDDADALMEEVTGQRLPVSRLPAWLLGRANADARISHDEQGRPTRLNEAGWQIDYSYEAAQANALPSRLTLNRDNEIELRLRIEEWKEAP